MTTINHARFTCNRATIDDVIPEGGEWYAVVCSWFGHEKACVRVNVTSIVESLVREEARRVLEDYCAGDEECMEYYWDMAMEEAVERIAESKLAWIEVRDHEDTIREQACPDLIDALAPRKEVPLTRWMRGG